MAQKQCSFFEKLFAGLGIFPSNPNYRSVNGYPPGENEQQECTGVFEDFFSWIFQQEKPDYKKFPR